MLGSLGSLGQLLLIIVVVFLVLHDLFRYFFTEKENRSYWLKWWVVLSIILGFAFWLILWYTGK